MLDDAAQQYVRVYSALNKLLVLMSSTVQAPAPLSALNDLQGILSGTELTGADHAAQRDAQ